MNAPRVTEKDLDEAIVNAQYLLLPDDRTTICMLTLDNGFTVRGESSCVSRDNYKAIIGEEFAYKDARSKLWQLLGFRLADKLAREARRPTLHDAGTGRFVSPEHEKENPLTTVKIR